MTIIKTISILLFLFLLNHLNTFATVASDGNKPQNLTELKDSIRKILQETKTPGAGVVLVLGDETIMLEGFGKADIENNIDVNENTMFRLGSISKMYVALAILKLQEEGRVSLKDKIRDLIPEIEFNNPWEVKYPIRIENLLEHTTGWDDWHFAELGSDDPKPKTLKEALDYYPKSRTSRYIPGTRIAYSNVGTSVAAYIVEKVSGLTYEDYIESNFFKPMGIENMTFFQTEQYKKSGAKLYDNGIKLNYFNILYRPSAALNGSPTDMVKMIKFFINRGKINNIQLISDSSLQRMERSESMSLLSKYESLKRYGLANMPNYFNGFIYRGHGGSVFGGHAEFAYLPEYNMGYAVMINGDDENVVKKIAGLIKKYQTKDLVQKPVETDNKKFKITIDPSGYYTIINPKLEITGVFEHLKYIQRVWFENDTLYTKRLMDGNSTTKYIPAGNNEYRSINSKQIDYALIKDPLDGNIICCHAYLKKISPLWAYCFISIFIAIPVTIISTIIFGLIWTLVYLFGKNKSKTALRICLWPLIADLFIVVVVLSIFLTAQTRSDYFQLFGTVNIISVLILLCSICYALATVWSVFYIFRNRGVKMSKVFYFHSALAAILNFVFMLYFLSNGLIGVPTWI